MIALAKQNTTKKEGERMRKKDTHTTFDRENEAIMQPGEVSEAEYEAYSKVQREIYGEDTVKAAQRIMEAVNGLTLEHANCAIDLARHCLKRICKIQI